MYIYPVWNIFKPILTRFQVLYAIIFDYLYQIYFILTPKISLLRQCNVYIKFVVSICVRRRLSVFPGYVVAGRKSGFMNNPECGGGATNVYEYGVVMSMSDHRHYWWLLSLSPPPPPPPHSNKLNTYLLLKHTINTLHIL